MENTNTEDKKVEDLSLALTGKNDEQILEQVKSEFDVAFKKWEPRFREHLSRLAMYNNQKRDKQAIGDPLIFTIHQTVLAALYHDKSLVEVIGREKGDRKRAKNTNDLLKYDYSEMEKEETDYFWDWDATFFGTGLVCMLEYDRETHTPVPDFWDRLTTVVDPTARTIKGDKKGRGRARFIYHEVDSTESDMEDIYKNVDYLTSQTKIKSQFVDAKDKIEEARGLAASSSSTLKGNNKTYKFIEGFTTIGKKVYLVSVSTDFKKVLRISDTNRKKIPIADRRIYPFSKDFDGISVPDLVEDKQRGRAIVINASMKKIRGSAIPSYLYNKDKFSNNKSQLLNFEAQKFVGVDGDPINAVMPFPKDTVKNDVEFILNLLDHGAQVATSTPDLMGQDGQQTATEKVIQENKVGKRYGLSAKIFGWSERDFWKLWLEVYRDHMDKDIDQKRIRISGFMGAYKYAMMAKDDIIPAESYDFSIESTVLAEARKQDSLNKLQLFITTLQNIPGGNMRAAAKEQARLLGLDDMALETILPPTPDELQARAENIDLDAEKFVAVNDTDDHTAHILEHNEADDSAYKYAHIQAHIDTMKAMKEDGVDPNANSTLGPLQAKAVGPGANPGMTPSSPFHQVNNTP